MVMGMILRGSLVDFLVMIELAISFPFQPLPMVVLLIQHSSNDHCSCYDHPPVSKCHLFSSYKLLTPQKEN